MSHKSQTMYILHPWVKRGGMGYRIQLLVRELAREANVVQLENVRAVVQLIFRRLEYDDGRYVLFYTALAAPFVLCLRFLRSDLELVYMVRGDEITYVSQAGRRVRASIAWMCQRIIKAIGVKHVFVCADLQVLFEKRYGRIKRKAVLPNTLGVKLPRIDGVGGHIAIVGDFGTVKNTEWVLENLKSGLFEVHLYGNTCLPERFNRPWLKSYGIVEDLAQSLKEHPALLVLPYVDAGFPNVINDALLAGCPSIVHDEFPFKYLPYHPAWRFTLRMGNGEQADGDMTGFEQYLLELRDSDRDFAVDNQPLIRLVESSWRDRVWEVFG